MRRTLFLSLVLATALAGGCRGKDRDEAAAPPAGSAPVGTSGDADIKGSDKDFARDVAIANMAEIDMARMAAERGTDTNVKKFAQMMIDDHNQAGTKLQALAAQHHLEIPAQADDDHKEKARKLGEKKGLEFDRDYADAMVDGHQAFVDTLEPRIDKDTLAKWKATQVDPVSGKKVESKAEAISIVAEKSDNAITQSLNQFAADTYPVAFAHLQAAKDLQKGLKRRTTTP